MIDNYMSQIEWLHNTRFIIMARSCQQLPPIDVHDSGHVPKHENSLHALQNKCTQFLIFTHATIYKCNSKNLIS